MDEGFDFHWYAGKPPYFITPDGKKLKCKMKGRVPKVAGIKSSALKEARAKKAPVFSNLPPSWAGQRSGR